jgi:hypothetical protein
MNNIFLTRREFLQLTGIMAVGFLPYRLERFINPESHANLLRVTAEQVHIRKEPNSRSEIVYSHKRDDLLHGYYPVDSGQGNNPSWYRTWRGFVFSGFTQPVEFSVNDPVDPIPDDGFLAIISIPYTRTMLLSSIGVWQPNYRLYFGSTHWVKGIRPGPDDSPWYELGDWYRRTYFVKAAHLRPVSAEELAPIHADIPRHKKWIEISISQQKLWAFEDGKVVLETKMSSGLPLNRPLEAGELSSETPFGDHFITVKSVSRHMGERRLTDQIDCGALPGVPWVSFFDKDGYSLHGTYWHSNFGNRMSHGCVNLRNEDALWLYRWVEPYSKPGDWEVTGWGTRVSVRE